MLSCKSLKALYLIILQLFLLVENRKGNLSTSVKSVSAGFRRGEGERGEKEVMSCIERGREEEREPRLYWAQNGSLCVVARMLKGTS